MPYQYRNFTPSNNHIDYSNKQAFSDIYVVVENLNSVGIKIRDPQQEQYGWSFKKFEVKILIKVLNGLEWWKKDVIRLPEKVKLKKNHNKGSKRTCKLYQAICKALMKSKLSDQAPIKQWCKYAENKEQKMEQVEQINQQGKEMESSIFLFEVRKIKQKMFGRESANITVLPLFHQFKMSYKTVCEESHNEKDLIDHVKSENVSYPSLLNYLIKQIKQK